MENKSEYSMVVSTCGDKESAKAIAKLLIEKRLESHPRQAGRKPQPTPVLLGNRHLDYEWNVSNSLARAFYTRHGAERIEPAFELRVGQDSAADTVVMTTRLCIKYELGWCPKHSGDAPHKKTPCPKGDLYLSNGETILRCEFDCEKCCMRLHLR